MNGKKSILAESTLRYVIATVIGQGASFLGVVLFMRLMSQEDYGLFGTYYSYVSIFTVLIGANLYYSLNNAYIDKKSTILSFRKTVLFLSAMIMLGVLLLSWTVGDVLLKKLSAFEIVLGALHAYSFFVVSYRVYSANMENDYRRKQWLLILPNVLQLAISLGFVLAFRDFSYQARIAGSTIGVGGVAAVCFVEMMRSAGPLVDREAWRYALSISLPSVVMSLSFMLMQHCDKIMITGICGAESTAVYLVIYYLGYAISAVDQAASPVRLSWLYRRLDENDPEGAVRFQKWYLFIMAALATCAMMLGPDVIRLLAPKSYWRFEFVLPFVVGACMMLMYRFNTEVIMYHKKNMPLSRRVLFCTLLNIALNAVFIPRFGAVAACYTTVASYLLLFILTWILSEKVQGKLYSLGWFGLFTAWMACVAVVYAVGLNAPPIRYAGLLASLGGMAVYALRNMGELRDLLRGDMKDA